MTYVFVDDKTKLPKKAVDNYYPTDPEFIKKFIEEYWDEFFHRRKWILDPGCGDGNWGSVLHDMTTTLSYLTNIIGVEINETLAKKAISHGYKAVHIKKFQEFEHSTPLDLVFGNPPFDQHVDFINHALELTVDGGFVVFLLPTLYIAGNRRYNKIYKNNGFYKMIIPTKRVKFIGHGNSPMKDTAIFVWKKGYFGSSTVEWIQNE